MTCRPTERPPPNVQDGGLTIKQPRQPMNMTFGATWELVTNARGAGGAGSAIWGLPVQLARATNERTPTTNKPSRVRTITVRLRRLECAVDRLLKAVRSAETFN